MTDWFRSWHGAPTDAKWLLIARKSGTSPVIVSAVAWALFDHASQHEERGTVADFDAETYAAWAGVEEPVVEAIIAAMADKGLIHDGRLSAWEKRQPNREDDSSARTRAYRERKQPSVTERHAHDVTQCDAIERTVTPRDAPDKKRVDTETDTDTETETEKTTTRAAREASRDTPYAVFAAFLGVAGADEAGVSPAWKSKQLAVAKRLLEQGYGDIAVSDCAVYMRSQSWRTSPFDLVDVERYIGKWELAGKPTTEEAQPRARQPPGRRSTVAASLENVEAVGRMMEQWEQQP